MADKPDYLLLDNPAILQLVFHPRNDWTPPPQGSADHTIQVEDGISVLCRFYPVDRTAPSIVYFHGNGEVVCDHDWVAPLYNRIGVNLFVSDYRGYGQSEGNPTFTSTAADAHIIFNHFMNILESNAYVQSLFVMGRSLGSIPAVELAASYPDRITGLILESGFADLIHLLKYLGISLTVPSSDDFEEASLERIHHIEMPVLLIHGEHDTLIPPSEALHFFENVGAKQKKLLTIPDADHNTILLVGMNQYFEAIREFVHQ